MKKLHSTSFRPSIESLEERQMLAGDVRAFVSAGHLHVQEATGQLGGANAVEISQLANGNLRVKGIANQAGGTTKVNGALFRDFAVQGDLKVNLAGGRDTVKLVANAKFNNVTINVGAASAFGNADLDVVIADRVTTRGSMKINTGASGDFVDVLGSRIGDDARDNLHIQTGPGGDRVRVLDAGGFTTVKGTLGVRTYNLPSENDTDDVSIENVIVFKNLSVVLGGGHDILKVTEVTALDDIYLSAGDGDDRMTMNSVQAIDTFFVFLGEGSDALHVQFLRADSLSLDGGGGRDRLMKSVDGPVNRLFLNGWEPLIDLPVFHLPIDPPVFHRS